MTRFFPRVLFAACALSALSLPALAQEDPPTEPSDVYDIAFPIDGPHSDNYDNFGDCRSGCSRSHEGADIMADKLTPVVAAADGVVTSVRGIELDGTPVPGGSQWLVVQHDGWQTRYLHLNNDTAGTDDGLGFGITDEIIAAFVAAGGDDWNSGLAYPVARGQVIGWVGDSGNAEESGSHLHFELRVGDGWDAVAIDPYPSLLAADIAATKTWNGFFADDDDSVHEKSIDALAEDGITRGCNPPANTNYCPEQRMTRGQVAAFIRRTLALPSTSTDYFTDDDGSVFNDDINAVVAADIGFGCSETAYCPGHPLLRDEMAQMLVKAFEAANPDRYANPDGTDFFVDDDGNRFEESINRLMAADVTRGCNPPENDHYCPDRPLTRAEMASFFVRALDG